MGPVGRARPGPPPAGRSRRLVGGGLGLVRGAAPFDGLGARSPTTPIRRSSRSRRAYPPVVDVGARQQRPRVHELHAVGAVSTHLGQPVGDHLRGPGQFAGPQRCRLGTEPFGRAGSNIDEPRGHASGTATTITRPPNFRSRLLREAAWFLADVDHFVHAGVDAARIPGGEGVHELVQ